MHSSRMLTVRSSSRLLVCVFWGRGCLLGRFAQGDLPMGVSAQRGRVSQHALRQTVPLWTEFLTC